MVASHILSLGNLIHCTKLFPFIKPQVHFCNRKESKEIISKLSSNFNIPWIWRRYRKLFAKKGIQADVIYPQVISAFSFIVFEANLLRVKITQIFHNCYKPPIIIFLLVVAESLEQVQTLLKPLKHYETC